VPALAHVVRQWTEWAQEAGFAGLYVAQMNGVLWSQTAWNLQPGVQGIAEFYPNLYASTQLRPSHALWANYHARFGVDNPRDYFYGVHASFNNKPRHLADGRETVLPYHPVNLRHALRQQLGRTGNDSYVFLNAWNEWGEGEAVEPSQEFGHSWLQAIKDAIADDATGIEGPLVPFGVVRDWLVQCSELFAAALQDASQTAEQSQSQSLLFAGCCSASVVLGRDDSAGGYHVVVTPLKVAIVVEFSRLVPVVL
jgi:hypothetical protein